VLEETEQRENELSEAVSRDYLDRMKKGLSHWVEGGRNGHLTWGIHHFRAE
jgi:sarcosine/dimethylglycine N-methyltransferase